MNNLIKNIPFKVMICSMLVMTYGACTTMTRVSETDYNEIDQKKTYYITLIDGTKHAADRISVTDSTLTIYETKHMKYHGYTNIKADELPYTVNLSNVDSVREKRLKVFQTILASAGVLLVLCYAYFASSFDIEG